MNDIVEAFLVLDTATVSDALDKAGIDGQVPGVKPFTTTAKLCGRAHTLRYEPVGTSTSGTVGDFIDDIDEGSVVVIANEGRTDCTVWGDILTTVASRRHLGGTVIDGICRDVALSLKLRYPIFARDAWMRTGKDRVTLTAQQVGVSLGPVAVAPGDLLLGDADGVVVVPWDEAPRVLEIAQRIDAAETEIRRRVANGGRLDRAREDLGYHSLQTRDDSGEQTHVGR